MDSGRHINPAGKADATRQSPVALADLHGHVAKGSSDVWLFNTEAVSTLLIAFWFIIGSFARLGIIPRGALYDWIGSCLVPILFYIFYFGTGYLFQQHQKVHDVASWKRCFRREVVILLTPCLAFTLLALITGSVIATTPGMPESGIVPSVLPFSAENIVDGLLIHPVVASGYFIVLVLFFFIGRTPSTNTGMNTLLACTFVVKLAAIVLADMGLLTHVSIIIRGVLDNWIWFVLGMAVSFYRIPPKIANRRIAVSCVMMFLVFCVILFLWGITESFLVFFLSLVGLSAFYCTSAACFYGKSQVRFFGFVGRYTMAIWLMHPSVSELVFCLLFALGCHTGELVSIEWVPLYAVMCVVSCYVLPILILWLLNHIWKLGFLVYPARYLPANF